MAKQAFKPAKLVSAKSRRAQTSSGRACCAVAPSVTTVPTATTRQRIAINQRASGAIPPDWSALNLWLTNKRSTGAVEIAHDRRKNTFSGPANLHIAASLEQCG